MAKSVGDKIGQAEYATLYTEVSNILGNPVNVTDDTNAYGWNLTPVSSNVSVGSKVTAADWNNLRTDILNAYDHIVNSTTTSPTIATLSVGDEITAVQYNNMETISAFNYLNRFTTHATHLTSSSFFSTLTDAWNGTKTLSVVCTWPSLTEKLAFWNAGGILRFSFSGANSSGSNKDADYLGALNGFGTADLTARDFSTTGPAGTVYTTRDFYFLKNDNNAQDRTLIRLDLSDVSPSYTVYDENYIRVLARDTSSTQMTFKFQVVDADVGEDPEFGIDENVNTDVTGTLTALTPNSNIVSATAPTFSSAGWV